MASGVSKATKRFMRWFRPGLQENHLPDFSVILKKTSHLPATQAAFIVPLWFSKFDLRDYLWHAYGVATREKGIRVYVKQGKIVEGKTNQAPAPKQWRREQATKHMTVDLCEPFVWPEQDPDVDKSVWRVNERQDAEDDHAELREKLGAMGDTHVPKKSREAMRAQAQLLQEGKKQWRPGTGKGW